MKQIVNQHGAEHRGQRFTITTWKYSTGYEAEAQLHPAGSDFIPAIEFDEHWPTETEALEAVRSDVAKLIDQFLDAPG